MSSRLFSPDVLDALKAISAGATARELESETLEFEQDAATSGETLRVLVDAAM